MKEHLDNQLCWCGDDHTWQDTPGTLTDPKLEREAQRLAILMVEDYVRVHEKLTAEQLRKTRRWAIFHSRNQVTGHKVKATINMEETN